VVFHGSQQLLPLGGGAANESLSIPLPGDLFQAVQTLKKLFLVAFLIAIIQHFQYKQMDSQFFGPGRAGFWNEGAGNFCKQLFLFRTACYLTKLNGRAFSAADTGRQQSDSPVNYRQVPDGHSSFRLCNSKYFLLADQRGDCNRRLFMSYTTPECVAITQEDFRQASYLCF